MSNCVVKIGPDGTFKRSGDIRSSPVDIDSFFSQLQNKEVYSSPPRSITLYFHGGLVSESAGLAIARKMIDHLHATETIPVFFIWETSIRDAIVHKLEETVNNSVFRKITGILLKYIAARANVSIGDEVARGSMLSNWDIDQQLQLERPFADCEVSLPADATAGNEEWVQEQDLETMALMTNELRRAVECTPDLVTLLQESAVSAEALDPDKATPRGIGLISGFIAKRLIKVVVNVMKRLRTGAGHTFYPIIIEEIFREFYIAATGAWIWSSMKSKACNMWQENKNKTGDDQFAGTYFLEAMVRFVKQFPRTRVHVVGHSAGSICICHMLGAVRQYFPGFKFETIVFLAPACRIDLFHEQVVRYPQLYNCFRCYTMTDENECNDLLVPYIYPRSLLYLVSGILEEDGKKADVPVLGLHRFLNGTGVNEENAYLSEVQKFLWEDNRLVLSATAGDALAGLQSRALRHGDFDDDEITIASIKHLISR